VTQLMAIVNATPDSFYADSRNQTLEMAIQRAFQCLDEGADILDIGGESTRPGAEEVPLDEEIRRVIPVIQAVADAVAGAGKIISVDTRKPAVAKAAIEAGATMINDVGGFRDPEMVQVAKESGATCCVMHMQKNPKTMQDQPFYERGVVVEVTEWLQMQASMLLQAGIERSRIIVDPGIGFGKSVEDNFMLLSHVKELKRLGFPLLYGISRKSFLRKTLNKPTEELGPATLALDSYLALQGVDILRVHDVAMHRDLLTLFHKL